MTRKPTLSAWATRLGANPDGNATIPQLEAAIHEGINRAMTSGNDSTGITLVEGLHNNWQVLKAELPGTISAVAAQFRN